MGAPFRIQCSKEVPLPVQTTPTAVGGETPVPSAPALTAMETFQFYMERLIKLIPAEALAVYLTGNGFIKTTTAIKGIWPLICLGLVIVFRIWGTMEKGKPVQWLTVVVSAISFVIWVYAMGGRFLEFRLADLSIASLAVLVWTCIIPFVYKGD
ncbi:MAG: hypothetical protein ACM3SY_19950 [Candidatus Omnitrophota bacterium]